MVTDYSDEKNCEKLTVLMNLYTLKNYEICRFNNKKNMPLANLIHKVKSQQLFKNIYKRNLNVKCVRYSAFETSCTILSNFNF